METSIKLLFLTADGQAGYGLQLGKNGQFFQGPPADKALKKK